MLRGRSRHSSGSGADTMNARTSTIMILASLVAVLTLAASAWGACAWIQWEQTVLAPADPAWSIAGSYMEKTACEQAIQTETQRTLRESAKARLDRGVIVADVGKPGQPVLLMRSMLCLPDTVDPRGPKASGR